MCRMCEEIGSGRDGFAIVDRPSERLAGLFWEGTLAEAAAGAARDLLKEVRSHAGPGELWSSPIVCLSWSDADDRLRHFAGVTASEAPVSAPGWPSIDLPAGRWVADWHGPADGDVLGHYGRMIMWLSTTGHRRAADGPLHREDYPRDADLDGPPVLRLMLPLA
jgi:hypothetical protein